MKTFRVISALLAAVFILLAVSCENSLYTLMSRTIDDPFDEAPRVRSFDRELTAFVSWKADEGTDTYVLRRSEDKNIPDFSTIVYKGENTSYVDSGLVKDTRYLYRLDKIRGNKTFIGKATSLAVGTVLQQDVYEDNNIVQKTTPFDSQCNANLYYYPFIDGRVLQDSDWYSIQIPPRATAQIKLSEFDLPPGNTDTAFICTIENDKFFKVIDNVAISIENSNYKAQVYSFMISANVDQFKSNYVDGTIRSYTLKLETITYK